MPRAEVAVEGELLEQLSEAFVFDDPVALAAFNAAYAKCVEAGSIPYLVARVDGLSIKIWADEHPPPHFHVEYQGESASFSILTCQRLDGVTGLERYEKTIRRWWQGNRFLLIEKWNVTRPTDCAVGPIRLARPMEGENDLSA